MEFFQLVCILVLAVPYALYARAGEGRLLALLAVSAWLGEASCIYLYQFYSYSEGWWLRLAAVPVLVPLIWPIVVLSSRDVVRSLWPHLQSWKLALAVGAAVTVDASMIEIIAVNAGLWAWVQPGYFQVPWIGLLGWGIFAACAIAALSARWSVLLAPLGVHAGLLLLWWGVFRWTGHTELGKEALVLFCGLMAVCAFFIHKSSYRLSLSVAGPRIPAALVFIGLLPGAPWPLWVHTVAVALPYLASMEWKKA